MRSFLLVVLIALLVILGGCGSGSGSGSSSSTSTTTVTPRYLLGGGYPFPADYSSLIPSASASMIADTAQVAYIQLHWQEAKNPGNLSFNDALASPVASARQGGLKVYVALDSLSPDRTQVELPSGLSGDFASPAVQQAYLDAITKAAATYKPDYFVLMVEANLNRNSGANYIAYQQLYSQAYDAVKNVSPSTKVGVSLYYGYSDFGACYQSADLSQLAADLAGFTKQDLFAVSVYPICYTDPKNIPDNFLFSLAQLSSHPLFISETGWPSQINGSAMNESVQASYFGNLQRVADYANSHGQKVDVVNYIGMIDATVEACDAIVQTFPQYSWWCSLGIRNRDGSPKLSVAAMKAWKQSLEATQ